MNRYIKRKNVRSTLEHLSGINYMRVDLTIYRHLDLMVEHEVERLATINKGKKRAKNTIELCPGN